jgi:hypothetical protein
MNRLIFILQKAHFEFIYENSAYVLMIFFI